MNPRYRSRLALPAGFAWMLLCLVLGCSGGEPRPAAEETAAPPEPAATLLGTSWRIVGVGDGPASDTTETELRFLADGQVMGHSGCNRFSGTATLAGSSVSFSPLVATRRACAPPLMEQENAILQALESVRGSSFADADHVDLLDDGGRSVLRLTRIRA